MKTLALSVLALVGLVASASGQTRGSRAATRPAVQPPNLDLQLELAIGLDNGPRSYIFGGIRGVCAQPTGEIVVVDKLDNTIRVFDNRGNFLREFAGHGTGKGQFVDPTGLRLREDLIEVADIANRRITSYGLDGRHLGDRPLNITSSIPANRLMTLRHGWVIGATSGRYTPDVTEAVSRVLVMGVDDRRVDTLATFHLGWVLRTRSNLGLKSPALSVGPGGDVAVAGDSMVAIVNGYEGIIQWYNVEPSGLQATVKRELQWTPVRIAQADMAEIRRRVRSTQGIPAGEGVTVETPRYFGKAERALLDDRGSVWMLLRERYAISDKLLVVGRESRDDAVVTLPSGFTLHCIANSRLYGSIRGQDDVPRVVVYRVVPGRPEGE